VLRNTMPIVCSIALVLLCCAASSAESEPRKWTDSTGKHTIQAVFVKFEDGKVVLQKSDGKLLALSPSKLSKTDQEFVRELLAAKRDGPALASEKASSQSDWLWWRGPNSNGVAAEGESPPTEWNETKNVVWKVPVPGRGHSSPIAVGDRVILSTADERAQIQSVVCFDRSTGRQLWKTDVSQGGFPAQIHKKNTHASPTVVSDGERLFAAFNNRDSVLLTALTLDGEQAWQITAGPYLPRKYKFGYAPSPLVYKNTVIVASEYEDPGYLAAFDRSTGREVWRTPRPKRNSFSSPIVGHVAGRDQLLISGGDLVSSYDPNNGRMLWSVPGTTNATCGTMVWDGNLVFASGGYPKKETIAVHADGSSRVAWKNGQKCYEQSMLAYDGHVYAVNDSGIAYCWDAKSGQERWKTRLGGNISASPILAGGNIYAVNEGGTIFVFRATPDGYQPVAQNQLGDEAFATPAICGDQIFMRIARSARGSRQETLYCIGKGQAE